MAMDCPLGLEKADCKRCEFDKEGLCDYPHSPNVKKMATICAVSLKEVAFDSVSYSFKCQCGCGMELSSNILTDITRQEAEDFHTLHLLLRRNGQKAFGEGRNAKTGI